MRWWLSQASLCPSHPLFSLIPVDLVEFPVLARLSGHFRELYRTLQQRTHCGGCDSCSHHPHLHPVSAGKLFPAHLSKEDN